MFKILFSLFLFPFSALAMQASNPTLVRIFDGKVVPCKETFEGGRPTFALSDLAVKAGNTSVALSATVNFAACVREGDKVSLQPRLPLDPIALPDVDGSPVQLEYNSPEFYLGDANYKPLDLVSAANENPQRVTLNVNLAKALTAAQKAELAQGKKIQVQTVLLFRAIVRSFSKEGYILLGQHSQGSFSVFFDLEK